MINRNTYLFLLGLLLASASQAQHLFSRLHLKMADSSRFVMVIDNIPYTHPANSFTLQLLPGMHLIRVQRPGDLFTLYDGLVELPPNTAAYAYIDYLRNFRVYHLSPFTGTGTGRYFPEPDISMAPVKGMNALAFYNLKSTLYNTNTSAEKLAIAENAVSQHTVSCGQLAELLRLIEFESHRIELAIFAYPFAIDQDNYRIIRKSFSFESSMKEVEEAVRREVK